jgi:hypothetical protein
MTKQYLQNQIEKIILQHTNSENAARDIMKLLESMIVPPRRFNEETRVFENTWEEQNDGDE